MIWGQIRAINTFSNYRTPGQVVPPDRQRWEEMGRSGLRAILFILCK